ncbi:MAG: c-type cytochrome [Chitinophagaceae bacterium]|nr:c-type cytochrome [Chitinophagaceae bacterium]
MLSAIIRKVFMKSRLKPLLMLTVLLTVGSSRVFAAEPPAPSALDNPLALTLITLMIILLIIIMMLGRLLLGLAEIKMKNEKEEKGHTGVTATMLLVMLFSSVATFAQDAGGATQAPATIGGLSAFAFYSMITILFVEMLIILVLLINMKFLLQKDKETVFEPAFAKPSSLAAWWGRLNKFKPIEQESAIALEHEYDGIRELDNRLPPWWLYGFYVTIIFSVVYLWRYHVAYSAPLSKEEFEISMKKADEKVKAYLEAKGESVDENTVTLLTDAGDLAAGKAIFNTACVACHKADGGGLVGPNLTDDYWVHGGDVKSIFKTIKYGINAMPQWQTSYSNKQIAQITGYVKSLHGTNPPDAKAQEGELYKEDAAAAGDGAATKN